jgi:ribosomal protein S18 acetylase RimI-like enzyme
VEIREARPEEYTAVAELTVQVYLDDGLLTADHPYVRELQDAAGRARDAELLVAVGGAGELIGSVTFAPPGSSYGEIADTSEAGFRMLVVGAAGRRRGVGAALVQACLARARRHGCVRVRMSSAPAMTAAHRLYERLGFVRTPERDWSPLPGVTLLTYSLELA